MTTRRRFLQLLAVFGATVPLLTFRKPQVVRRCTDLSGWRGLCMSYPDADTRDQLMAAREAYRADIFEPATGFRVFLMADIRPGHLGYKLVSEDELPAVRARMGREPWPEIFDSLPTVHPPESVVGDSHRRRLS